MTLSSREVVEAPARKWRRYPGYKESGVEWMEEIPEHWDVLSMKRVARRIQTGSTPPTAEVQYYEDGTVPWFGPGSFGSALMLDKPVKLISYTALQDGAARIFEGGSTMIVTIGATIGKVGYIETPASSNQQITGITFDTVRVIPKFAAYQIKRLELVLRGIAPNTTLPILDQQEVGTLPFCCPSLSEQRSITTFLDRETQKIDDLIGKRERLIGLLEEKRTALISRAVTKGLDPDVPMKDSGVEWLGEIPEHWTFIALRRLLARIEQGWSPIAEDREAPLGEWGVIKISAISRGLFRPEETKALPPDVAPDARYEIRAGDILLTRGNTPNLVGDVCVVGNTRPRLMLSDLVYRLSVNHQKVDGAYLTYWLLSRAGRYQITRDARGSSQSMVKISQEHIRSWSVTLPPLAEQQAIVAFVERETSKLDALADKVREHIQKLREYRTALISAAVTGKIDMRGEVSDSRGSR